MTTPVSKRYNFTRYFHLNSPCSINYIKIQLETIDITMRLYGVSHTNPNTIPPEPHSNVYIFKLNFNLSNVAY